MEDEHGHWLIIIVNIDNLKFILINIYGYNNIKENKKFSQKKSRHI